MIVYALLLILIVAAAIWATLTGVVKALIRLGLINEFPPEDEAEEDNNE